MCELEARAAIWLDVDISISADLLGMGTHQGPPAWLAAFVKSAARLFL